MRLTSETCAITPLFFGIFGFASLLKSVRGNRFGREQFCVTTIITDYNLHYINKALSFLDAYFTRSRRNHKHDELIFSYSNVSLYFAGNLRVI